MSISFCADSPLSLAGVASSLLQDKAKTTSLAYIRVHSGPDGRNRGNFQWSMPRTVRKTVRSSQVLSKVKVAFMSFSDMMLLFCVSLAGDSSF